MRFKSCFDSARIEKIFTHIQNAEDSIVSAIDDGKSLKTAAHCKSHNFTALSTPRKRHHFSAMRHHIANSRTAKNQQTTKQSLLLRGDIPLHPSCSDKFTQFFGSRPRCGQCWRGQTMQRDEYNMLDHSTNWSGNAVHHEDRTRENGSNFQAHRVANHLWQDFAKDDETNDFAQADGDAREGRQFC